MNDALYLPPREMVANVCEKDTLTEEDVWESQEFSIWRAKQFSGSPVFYPLYRSGDYFSYSPFLLAVARGHIRLDQTFVENSVNHRNHAPINTMLDADVRRIGGPPVFTSTIKEKDEFVAAIVSAMQTDIDRIERVNSGKTNFILCGGKDSLNLLLLKWSNGVVALSAQPNFPLVQQFVAENKLDIEVRELTELGDEAMLEREVAECFCRFDMGHIRWGDHLGKIARDCNRDAVFWNGAMADAFLTPFWQIYTGRGRVHKTFRRWCRRCIQNTAPPIDRLVSKLVIPDLQRTMWERGAAWQGGCLGHYRAITNCLTLSAYHGRETTKVWQAIDLVRVCKTDDIRSDIGFRLAGREVLYPTTNPGPPVTESRSGIWGIDRFLDTVGKFGVEIRE